MREAAFALTASAGRGTRIGRPNRGVAMLGIEKETVATSPASRVWLQFRHPDDLDATDAAIHLDLSAAASAGNTLFVSSDETAGFERLTRNGEGWGDHVHHALAEWIDLPAGADGEMDVEGLALDGDWLWLTGSHALKRAKPGAEDDPASALGGITRIRWDRNRQFLGRVPLRCKDGLVVPVGRDGERGVQHWPFSKRGALRRWLKGDDHLGRFLDLPSKDNGLDIEGLAARGLRVWLGLRGPVLGGYAVILEMQMKVTGRGHLKPRRIDRRRRYRKHFIDARGLGIRDLALDGEDLLVLTGTPLAGEGPARILRWAGAVHATTSGVWPGSAAAAIAELPFGHGVNNPEALARLDDGRWLVVYDSPSQGRLAGARPAVSADLWTLPEG